MKDTAALIDSLAVARKKIESQMEKVIVGQKRVIEEILIALFSGGHCLIEGVPGLAKTLMISTLAKMLSLKFSRIQFTPDLMPSDITGTHILIEEEKTGQRSLRWFPGPLFSNVILADEINRTPPKTQSALLQAMQEYQVSAANETFDLEKPFLVLATQNPIEQEGTYPLPEAQLDRFMFKISIGYPSREEEMRIVEQTTSTPPQEVEQVMRGEEIVAIQNAVRQIPVSDHVVQFAVDLVRSTRPDSDQAPELVRKMVSWGAGPRASQYLVLAAKTRAALYNRPSPSEDDIRQIAGIVLRHRVIVSFAAVAEGRTSTDIVRELAGVKDD